MIEKKMGGDDVVVIYSSQTILFMREGQIV
jgi:hypothetical protein